MIVVLKTVVLYVTVVMAMRIMGKRQIGELQPSELVTTLFISEIATIPLQDDKRTIVSILIPIATLVVFEYLISFLGLKLPRFRNFVQGNSVIIIREGKVDFRQLKKLRFTLEDVEEELRKNGVFNIKDVKYAVAETDGSISVMANNPDDNQPANDKTANDIG